MGRARLGLIGTSGWAEMIYLSSLADDPNGSIVAICSRGEDRRKAVAEGFGIARQFANYHDLVGSGEIDAVIVATPDDTHHEVVVAAAKAGLHVLCEKPLAENSDVAREMQQAVETAGVFDMVLFTWRWQPHFQLLKQMIDRGELGRVTRGQFSFIGGFARNTAYQWRLDPARGTGALGDLGSHMIDMARWMLGAPESVSAQLNTIVDRSAIAGHEAGSANDTARLLLRFADCPDVLVEASIATPMGDRFVQQIVRIEGTEASVEIDHVFGGAEAGARIRISRGGEAFTPVAVPEAFTAGADPADLFSLYRKATVGARLFTHCIASGHREGPSFADGVAVQQVIDAAFRSDREGQRITL